MAAAHLQDADAEYLARYGDPDRGGGRARARVPIDAEVEPARRQVAMRIDAIANGSLANCKAHIDGELQRGLRRRPSSSGTVRFTD